MVSEVDAALDNAKSDEVVILEHLQWLSDNISWRDSFHIKAEKSSRAVTYANTQSRAINKVKEYIFRKRENLDRFHHMLLHIKLADEVFQVFFKLYCKYLPVLEVMGVEDLDAGRSWMTEYYCEFSEESYTTPPNSFQETLF